MRICKYCKADASKVQMSSKVACRKCVNKRGRAKVIASRHFRDHSSNPLTMSWSALGAS